MVTIPAFALPVKPPIPGTPPGLPDGVEITDSPELKLCVDSEYAIRHLHLLYNQLQFPDNCLPTGATSGNFSAKVMQHKVMKVAG